MKEKVARNFIKSYGKYIVILTVFILICYVLLYLTYKNVKREMVADLNARQMIHAKQAAKGIESFFDHLLNMLIYLSKTDSIVTLDDRGKALMRLFYSNNSPEIRGITRVDARGRIQYTFPYNPEAINADISYQEHVKEIIRTHKPVVSDVFTAVQGFRCVAFHVPVFLGNVYQGSVAILIPFNYISKKYLEDIKIGESGYAWMISRKGVELYCPVPGHVGNSVFDNFRNFPDILAMAERMIRGEQGVTTYQFDRIRGNVVNTTKKYAVFMPIHLENNFWSIVIATPEDEVMGAMQGFQNRLLLIAVLFMIGIGFFFYLLFRTRILVDEIDRRQKTEETLRESEERYRTIFENTGTATVIIEEDTIIALANTEFVSLVGYAREEIEGKKSWTEFIVKEDVERMLAQHKLRREETGAAQKSYDFRLVDREGRIKEIHLTIEMIAGTKKSIASLLDITERKRVEDDLRKSQEMYRLLVDNANDGIFIAQEGIVKFPNSYLSRVMGYSLEELSGQPFAKFLHPEDLRMVSERHIARLRGETDLPSVYDFRVQKKDGTYNWVELNTVLIEWEKKPATLNFLRDITKRKLAEESLRESEEKFRSVVESSLIGIFIVNDTFRFTDANDELCRILGYSREEIIGHDFREFLDDESRKLVADRYVRRQRGEDIPNRYEFNIVRKDGEKRRTELIPAVIKYSAGNIMTVGQLSDITERKRAEEELQKSEEKYRTIIENMEEGYIEVDLAGSLTFFNEAARQFLGYSKEETMGMHYKKYADKKNAEDIFRLYKEVYRTHLPKQWFEWEVIRQDGIKRTIDGSASWISDAEGRPVGFRSLFRDVTDRKRLQEEREQLQERLHRAEKMEALGTLAGGVAHDINNVLGVLVGYSELLLQNLPQDSPLRRHTMHILQGGERTAAIIQDLLTLTRRGVVVSEVVNLNIVISELLQTPEFEAIKNHHPSVKFKTSLDEELLNVKGSPTHLGKTFINLLSNAAEAITGFGEVVITTENRYVDRPIQGYDSTQEGEYVVLTVSDTGSGISPADIGRIFEPFYTKKVMGRSGTGLGLAVVWGTVKDHKGYIEVQSADGKGTTFTLYFPLTREAVTSVKEAVPRSTYIGRGERILIVDDVEGQRLLASAMLEGLGYKVDSVASGEEAIEVVQRQPVDLLVLDMIMDPGIDGLETYRRILEIRNGQKAIIVSGFAMTERVRQMQELGAGAYVKKPYLLEKIGLAVRKELDRM